jgi:AraC-like DNA-binding protein
MPQLTNLVIRPDLSCLLQHDQLSGKVGETVVPPNDTHHILLFWTQGVDSLNYRLDTKRQRSRIVRWEGIHIPPGLPSWWENTRQASNGLFHIHIAKSLVDSCAYDRPVQDRRAASRRELEDPLRQLAAILLRETGGDTIPSQLWWDSYAVLLAHQLQTAEPMLVDFIRGGLAPWQVRRCTEYLSVHMSDNVGLDDLSALVDLSPFHFARAFKQSTGVPPHRYQVGLRIARAKVLLEATDAPVTQIAFDVGYESSQALARLFRREVGLSPSDYRRAKRV